MLAIITPNSFLRILRFYIGKFILGSIVLRETHSFNLKSWEVFFIRRKIKF